MLQASDAMQLLLEGVGDDAQQGVKYTFCPLGSKVLNEGEHQRHRLWHRDSKSRLSIIKVSIGVRWRVC
jgi:hypothetical protein